MKICSIGCILSVIKTISSLLKLFYIISASMLLPLGMFPAYLIIMMILIAVIEGCYLVICWKMYRYNKQQLLQNRLYQNNFKYNQLHRIHTYLLKCMCIDTAVLAILIINSVYMLIANNEQQQESQHNPSRNSNIRILLTNNIMIMVFMLMRTIIVLVGGYKHQINSSSNNSIVDNNNSNNNNDDDRKQPYKKTDILQQQQYSNRRQVNMHKHQSSIRKSVTNSNANYQHFQDEVVEI